MRMWIGDDIVNRCSHWCGPFQGFPPVTIPRFFQEHPYNACHCEPVRTLVWQSVSQSLLLRRVVLRAANQNRNDCKWQSYLNVAQTGVVIRIPKPSLPGKVEWCGRERSYGQNSWTMFTSSTRAIYCQGTPHLRCALVSFKAVPEFPFSDLRRWTFSPPGRSGRPVRWGCWQSGRKRQAPLPHPR